jgi:VWFA-related protein
MRRHIYVTFVLLAGLAQFPAPAQTVPTQTAPTGPVTAAAGQFAEQVSVGEVLLDVLVTDRGGNPIVGLGPDDFVVREDGAPIALTSATFCSTHRLLSGDGAAQNPALDISRVPEDRYFILFFHDQRRFASEVRSLFSQQMAAFRDARRWLASKEPNDWVAVAVYDYKLAVHQDFTRDATALDEALERAMRGADPGAEWPSRIDVSSQPLLSSLPRGQALGEQSENVYDAMHLLADAAGNVAGRKNLIYFGLGFGRLNSLGHYEPDPRYYPALIAALNDHNVAVYTVDLLAGYAAHELADALNQLADDSGGRPYTNFTSFITPLREIAHETSGTYLLSYRSSQQAGATARFQKVDIKTRNPSFKVRARSGYLVAPAETP